ncbi:MAG: hypothetical protein ACOYON_05350 [Fimbriimonas sp.]
MKNTLFILAAVALGAALVGCESKPTGGAPAVNKQAEIPEDLKKSNLPPEAQQEIANRMGSLPPGAAKPMVGADGKVSSAAPPPPTTK